MNENELETLRKEIFRLSDMIYIYKQQNNPEVVEQLNNELIDIENKINEIIK